MGDFASDAVFAREISHSQRFEVRERLFNGLWLKRSVGDGGRERESSETVSDRRGEVESFRTDGTVVFVRIWK